METKKEKFQETWDKMSVYRPILKKQCIEFLVRVLKANKNHMDFEDDDDYESCYVMYDGGNHPEYDVNPSAVVHSITLKNDDTIILDVDGCDEYYLDSLTLEDLYDVCDFIDRNLLPPINNEE